MAILPLSDAREKVKRARKQLAELDVLITPTDPDANRILVDYDPKQGCHVVRVVVREWPPREASFVAGEAIHSLRSALDYIAWQLAIAHKGREPTEKEAREISFPISNSPERFGTPPVFGHIAKEAAEEIRLHQPWMPTLPDLAHAPALLATLRDLSNMDKHRLLMARGYHWLDTARLSYRCEPAVEGFCAETIPVIAEHEGDELPARWAFARIKLEPAETASNVKVKVDPQPVVSPQIGGFDTDADVETLKALADCVEFIVARFDKRFFPLIPDFESG
jgi:hypothetical protein